jgi:uncharacterized protein (TIGR01244 family)
VIFRRLDAATLVAGQIRPEDMIEIRAVGVATVINNRLDCEEAGQPTAAEIEAAARAAGLDYRHIPVGGGFSIEQVEAMAEALESGPALAFCRSGTRSTYLWALAKASRGAEAEDLALKAAMAGFDLSPIRPWLR